MKKGMTIAQVFIYIMTLVVFASILIFGYRSIAQLKEKADRVECVQFQKQIKSDIEGLAYQYKAERVKEYQLPPQVQKVCFVDSSVAFTGGTNCNGKAPSAVSNANDTEKICTSSGSSHYDTLVCDSWCDKTANIFLLPINELCSDINIPQNTRRNHPLMQVDGGSLCIPTPNGYLKVKLKSEGDYTVVETP